MDVSDGRSTNATTSSDLEPNADQFLSRLIRKKSRQIVGQAGSASVDEVDIEQELRLKVVKHLSAYNGEKGHLYPFLTAVVERQAANVVRHQKAGKRRSHGTVYLSVEVKVEGEGRTELGATISDREANARLCRTSRSDHEASDLKHDVEAVIAKLTPDERVVCKRLKYDSITQIAHDLDIPRSTIYDMLARWRQTFEDHNLHGYL